MQDMQKKLPLNRLSHQGNIDFPTLAPMCQVLDTTTHESCFSSSGKKTKTSESRMLG